MDLPLFLVSFFVFSILGIGLGLYGAVGFLTKTSSDNDNNDDKTKDFIIITV